MNRRRYRRNDGTAGWIVALVLWALVPVPAQQYPFRAEIEFVRGRWTGQEAEVVWRAHSEHGTAGYRVFRLEDDVAYALHDAILPADIATVGGLYAVTDPARGSGDIATYLLEEVRGSGETASLGEWVVTFEPMPKEPMQMAMNDADSVALAESVFLTGPSAKVLVRSNDVYAVSVDALAAVLDMDPVALAGLAEQALLKMHCDGVSVAYHVDPAEGVLRFYGEGRKTRYARDAVYWIEPGSGLHMLREVPEDVPVSTSQTFRASVDFEQDLVSMVEHSGSPREDLYFWTHIFSGNASIGERAFAVPLEGYASGDVSVTVRLTGWNDTPASLDHLVEIRFNGSLIGSFSFAGKMDAVATFAAPAAIVLPSGNELRIRGILQSGIVSSIFVVDGFETAYEQYYTPRSGLLEAEGGGNARIAPASFANPLAWNVTAPRTPVRIALADGSLPAGMSWEAEEGGRWILRERSGSPVLTPVAAGHGAWLLAETNRLDYLVIAPRAFEVPAQALADYRAGLGLRTAVALYEDVCDQFAGGSNTPEAMRTCLAYAHQHWADAPWMVVLGGWGHYDYFGAQTTATSYLPSLLGSDSATLRPADGLLADIVGNDGLPDLAIGRLPVQSVAQFDGYLAKLRAYEAAGPASWHGRVVFAADNADSGGDFTASNLDMATEAVKRYTVEHTSLDSEATAVVKANLRAAFTNGAGLVQYTGHGTYRQLAGENLLSYDDVTSMVNPPVPCFASLTCLIGRFDIYLASQRCLAEALVLQPNGGALAVYAPSGLSYNHYAALFGKEFHRVHAEERADAIGPALLRARRSFGPLTGLHADAIRTYNLLGDPALRLRGGEGGTPPWWVPTFAQWRWERLTASELAVPGDEGTATRFGSDLFREYAFGGLLPGLAVGGVEKDTGRATVQWNQRRFATDLDYRLMVSTNLLESWESAPPDVELAKTQLSDGAMDAMTAKIPFDSGPLFIQLKVWGLW